MSIRSTKRDPAALAEPNEPFSARTRQQFEHVAGLTGTAKSTCSGENGSRVFP